MAVGGVVEVNSCPGCRVGDPDVAEVPVLAGDVEVSRAPAPPRTGPRVLPAPRWCSPGRGRLRARARHRRLADGLERVALDDTIRAGRPPQLAAATLRNVPHSPSCSSGCQYMPSPWTVTWQPSVGPSAIRSAAPANGCARAAAQRRGRRPSAPARPRRRQPGAANRTSAPALLEGRSHTLTGRRDHLTARRFHGAFPTARCESRRRSGSRHRKAPPSPRRRPPGSRRAAGTASRDVDGGPARADQRLAEVAARRPRRRRACARSGRSCPARDHRSVSRRPTSRPRLRCIASLRIAALAVCRRTRQAPRA